MSIRKSWTFLFLLLLFLMMWATGELINIKILLCLIVCITGIAISKGQDRLLISKSVLIWFLIYILFNSFYLILSAIYCNDGAYAYINVDLIEPVIFFFIIASIQSDNFIILEHFILYVSLFLYLYIIVAFLSINGFLPFGSLPFTRQDIGGALPFGLIKATAEFTQWFYFLIPGNIALFVFRKDIHDRKLRIICSVNLLLSLVVCVLLLKTALIMVICFSIIFSLLLMLHNRKILITRFTVIKIIAIIMLIVIIWNILKLGDLLYTTVIQKLLRSFSTEDYKNAFGVIDQGGMIRIEQINDLLQTWLMKPLFGWGTGADSLNIIRGSVHGSYEMTYFAKLMQRGLIGISIYVILIGWMLYRLFCLIKRKEMNLASVFILSGIIGMLIANATNPYIESFDKLIILFAPLIVINIVSMDKAKVISETAYSN